MSSFASDLQVFIYKLDHQPVLNIGSSGKEAFMNTSIQLTQYGLLSHPICRFFLSSMHYTLLLLFLDRIVLYRYFHSYYPLLRPWRTQTRDRIHKAIESESWRKAMVKRPRKNLYKIVRNRPDLYDVFLGNKTHDATFAKKDSWRQILALTLHQFERDQGITFHGEKRDLHELSKNCTWVDFGFNLNLAKKIVESEPKENLW